MVRLREFLPIVRNGLLLCVLDMVILLPGKKETSAPSALLCGLTCMAALFVIMAVRHRKKMVAYADIFSIILGVFLLWEILITKLNCLHPVLFPALENVFDAFREDYRVMLEGILASMVVLLSGTALGLVFGTLLGLYCGWKKRLHNVFYPIANVLAPIPSVVFAPYIIALMPSFRSASVVVIMLGIFWPTFLKTILSVDSVDPNLIDSARILELSDAAMIFQVLLPNSIPGIVSGLRVTLTTAMMMLTFAEMMGATSGMGYYIVNYNTYGNYTKVIAGIAVVGIVVTMLNMLVAQVQTYCVPWKRV